MRLKQPPPDPYACRPSLLWVLCVLLAGAILGHRVYAADLPGGADTEPAATALLVIIVVLPDGTYKDYVKYYESLKECKNDLPQWHLQVGGTLDPRLSYTMSCEQQRKAGRGKFD